MGFFHDHSAREALNILCVDDDLATCQLYGEYGNILDWVVYQTLTVPAALDITSTRRFDAIVVDQSIGTDTGIDLIREIRRKEGPNQHAPFLMCTVYDMQEMADALNRFKCRSLPAKADLTCTV